jgi:autotransporter-associated beta strand protein
MMLLSNADKDVAGTPSANASCFIIDYKDSGKIIYYRYHNGSYTAVNYPASILNQWVDVVWGSNVCHNGSVLKSFAPKNFSDNTATFRLFYARSGMNGLRFKRVQMYDGDDLVRDLWPAVRENGAPCMYDSVTDKCYLNSKTGTFSIGPKSTGYTGAGTVATWSNFSGGRFDADANWSGGAAPADGDTASFDDSSSYAVTFPADVSRATALSITKASGTTTFDTTGASWFIPSASNYGAPLLFDNGQKGAFMVRQGDVANGLMKSENGVFRFTGGDSPQTVFASGAINFHDPAGTTPTTLNTVQPNPELGSLTEFAGGTSRLPNVSLAAASGVTGDGTLRFSGGRHDIFGTVTVKNRKRLGNELALEVTGQGTKVNLLGGYDGYPSGDPTDEGNYKAFHSDAIRVTDGATLTVTGQYFRTLAADFNCLVDRSTLNVDADYFAFGSLYDYSTSFPAWSTYNTNTVVFSDSIVNVGPSVKAVRTSAWDSWGRTRSYSWWHSTNTVFTFAKAVKFMTGRYVFKDCVGIFNGGIDTRQAGVDFVIDGGAFTNHHWSLNSTATLTINGGDHSCTNYMYLCASSGGPTALNIGGGKLTVPREFYFSRVSTGAKTILNLTGGELSTPAPKWAYGGGTLSSTVTMNLLGGVWRVPSIGAGYVRQIYANGGTIQATGASTTFLANNSNASSYLRLGPQGLRIFSDYAVTVAAAFTNVPDAVGLLIKDGSGALTLSGASTHSRTMVTNGVLKFAAAVVSHRGVEVVNGARLDVTGSNGRPILFSLTLGDAASRGELAIDNGVFVTATNFVTAKARIRLTDA